MLRFLLHHHHRFVSTPHLSRISKQSSLQYHPQIPELQPDFWWKTEETKYNREEEIFLLIQGERRTLKGETRTRKYTGEISNLPVLNSRQAHNSFFHTLRLKSRTPALQVKTLLVDRQFITRFRVYCERRCLKWSSSTSLPSYHHDLTTYHCSLCIHIYIPIITILKQSLSSLNSILTHSIPRFIIHSHSLSPQNYSSFETFLPNTNPLSGLRYRKTYCPWEDHFFEGRQQSIFYAMVNTRIEKKW